MKVRVRRKYLGAEGLVHRGQILEVSEQRFNQLTTGIHAANPLVDPVEVGYKMKAKMEPAPKNKMEPAAKNKRRFMGLDGMRKESSGAAKGAADPTPSPQTGGPTGAAKPASSSAQAQAPKTSTSMPREAERVSSPSTTRGSSLRGQTSSMPATGFGGKRPRGRPRLKG